MNDPPTPIRPGDWATLLASLTWAFVKLDALGIQLGHFKDGSNVVHYIAAVRDGSTGDTKWMLSTTAPSAGVVETLMTSTTANILKSGTTNSDDTVTYSGSTYTIRLFWDGAEMTCKAVV